MYETALKISDRDATRKKLAYLELQPIRPNDKPRMEAAHRMLERNSFELLQLRVLGGAETSPRMMQYNAGMVVYGNYSDLSQDWARMWKDGDQSATHMTRMMQTMSQKIDQLPDVRPYRGPEFPPGLARPVTTMPHPEPHQNVCRQFARTGSCSYGDRCKSSHAKQQQVYAAQLDDTDKQVMQLQETMNEVFNVTAETDASDPISKENFALTYDTAFASVGTEEFEQTNAYLAMMVQEERSEFGDQRSNDEWHL